MDKKEYNTDFREIATLKTPHEDRKTVSDDYVPEGFESVEEFLQDMREKYEEDIDYDRENREAAIEDKQFAAGDQWDPIVLQQRAGLPNLVINSVPQFTAQLVGDWRQDRSAIKVLPSEDSDVDIADLRASLIRSIETNSRADRTYDCGFESMVICGDGAWRVAVDYASDDVFDQDINIRPIDDALSVVWDHLSVDPTGRDARHCFVDDPLPRKEFDKIWPGLDPSELGSTIRNTIETNGWHDTETDTVRVTEYWRIIERKRELVLFADGTLHFLEEEDNLSEMIVEHGDVIKSRMAPCKYAQMHLVTGFAILDGPYEWKLNRLPIIRVSGRLINITGNRVRYGLVRFMKDPVRLRNFWRSVAAEQLGYAPKAQWLATAAAVEGREDVFRKAHLTRDPLLVYNENTDPPQRIAPPPVEAALLNEANVNTQDMKDITGIHDASLGIRSNETSGRAIMARQREGDIASLTFFDNGNASILETGDVINQLINQVYDGTRIIRIIGEDEQSELVRVNDPNDEHSPDLATGKYDVAMSTGASYTTRRVEAAQAMMEAVQAWPQLLEIAGDLVAKSQDWPGSQELSDRLRKTIPPHLLEEGDNPIPPEVQQQLQQMQQAIQLLQQENQSLQDTSQRENREIDIKGYEAETKRLKIAADNEADLELVVAKTITDSLNTPDPIQEHSSQNQGPSNSPNPALAQ